MNELNRAHPPLFSPEVKFNPWVGNRYATDGWDGLKLLIVGESFYEVEASKLEGWPERATDMIRWVIADPHWKFKFFLSIEEVLLGARPPKGDPIRERFWESVAFYNYFQRVMNTRADRPNEVDEREAMLPFENVLDVLQPDAVLVPSRRAWDSIKFERRRSVQMNQAAPSHTRLWISDDKPPILATWTIHPSAPARRANQLLGPAYRARVKQFVGEASEWLAAGRPLAVPE